MLTFDKTQADERFGERAVAFKDGERIGVLRIDKDDSKWLFRLSPDKASVKLTQLQGEPIVDLTGEELFQLHQAVSARKI